MSENFENQLFVISACNDQINRFRTDAIGEKDFSFKTLFQKLKKMDEDIQDTDVIYKLILKTKLKHACENMLYYDLETTCLLPSELLQFLAHNYSNVLFLVNFRRIQDGKYGGCYANGNKYKEWFNDENVGIIDFCDPDWRLGGRLPWKCFTYYIKRLAEHFTVLRARTY